MNENRALRVIAHQVLAAAHADLNPMWEDHPDIGEHDWDRVMDLVREMRHQYPSNKEYAEAYAMLSARANKAPS